jgi:uncharacterized protein (TIGR00106 family)
MALMQITIFPLATETPSVGQYIADIQKFLQNQKLPFALHDMGTIIEGNPQELLALAAELCEIPFARGNRRVITHITMDDRRDISVSLGDKLTSAERHMLSS